MGYFRFGFEFFRIFAQYHSALSQTPRSIILRSIILRRVTLQYTAGSQQPRLKTFAQTFKGTMS